MITSGAKSNELNLLLGLAAGHRHDGAAESFRAVVRAQAAGEQPVAVRHVHDVSGSSTRGADRAGHQPGPRLDIARGVTDDGRFSRRTAGGVHTDDLGSRYGKQAERIAFPQILLCGERKAGEICERAQIVGVRAGRCAFGLILRDVIVRVADGPRESFQLKALELVPARPFNRLEVDRSVSSPWHGSSPFPRCPLSAVLGHHR
jgi:hypothetical protein